MDECNKCATCGRRDGKLKFCSACRQTRYCNENCQSDHWSAHKSVCNNESLHKNTNENESILETEHMIEKEEELCFICHNAHSFRSSEMRYQPCCGIMFCNGCIYRLWGTDDENQVCPHCRQKNLTTSQIFISRLNERVKKGDKYAIHIKAFFHFRGKWNVPHDYNEAMKLWKQAGELGCLDSYNAISDMYRVGYGVERSVIKALQYTKMAAKKGSMLARHNIGLYTFYGIGMKADSESAVRHWKIAASAGFKPSLNILHRRELIERDEYKKTKAEYRKKLKQDFIEERECMGVDGKPEVLEMSITSWAKRYENTLSYLSSHNSLRP